MLVLVAKRAIVRRDLDRKSSHKIIRDDEMVARLLLDRNRVVAGIWVLGHGYYFDGLNSTRIMRTS